MSCPSKDRNHKSFLLLELSLLQMTHHSVTASFIICCEKFTTLLHFISQCGQPDLNRHGISTNGFSYYSMLPQPLISVVVWTMSLPYHFMIQVDGIQSLHIYAALPHFSSAFSQLFAELAISTYIVSNIRLHKLMLLRQKSIAPAYYAISAYVSNWRLNYKSPIFYLKLCLVLILEIPYIPVSLMCLSTAIKRIANS